MVFAALGWALVVSWTMTVISLRDNKDVWHWLGFDAVLLLLLIFAY